VRASIWIRRPSRSASGDGLLCTQERVGYDLQDWQCDESLNQLDCLQMALGAGRRFKRLADGFAMASGRALLAYGG
jgi:hypothetical protein